MKKQIGEYRHLAGSNRKRGTLWEGPDHLLYLERKGRFLYRTETVRRIDYTKVECIAYGRTRTWPCLTVGLGLFVLGTASVLVYKFTHLIPPSPGQGVMTILAGAALIALVIELSKGPRVKFHVQTAVKLHQIRPIGRLRSARKFAGQLAALCEKHQGAASLSPEALQGLHMASTLPRLGLITKKPLQNWVLLRWTMAVLILSGALLTGEPFVDNMAYLAVNGTAQIGAMILVTTALLKIQPFRVPASVKVCLWGAAGNLAAIALSVYSLLVYKKTSLELGGKAANTAAQKFNLIASLRWFSHTDTHALKGAFWIFTALGIASVLLAAIGLPAALKKVKPPKAPMPPPLPAPTTTAGSGEIPQ